MSFRSAVIALVILVLAGCAAPEGREPGPMAEAKAEIPVMVSYDSKIVYTTDKNVDAGPLREDCAKRGGKFNECGDICPPGTFICTEVCAYTCEFGEETRPKAKPMAEKGPSLPKGFRVYRVVSGLHGIGDFAGPDGKGNCWIARPGAGTVTMIRTDGTGDVMDIANVYDELQYPQALVLDPVKRMELYYANSGALYRVRLYSKDSPERLDTIPDEAVRACFGVDGRLYIHTPDQVLVLEGSRGIVTYADGPAGQGGLAVDPVSGELWVAGKDGIWVVRKGALELRTWLPEGCGPASLGFVPEAGWPADTALDLLAACRDSGDVLHLDLDAERHVAAMEIFMSRDWRPSDMDLLSGGVMRFIDTAKGSLITFDRASN